MLPSERSELLLRRVAMALLILMALFVLTWTVRFIWQRANRLMQQRNIPVDEGRACLPRVG